MATKSHFCEAMLSIAARCLTASSWPSNQVTSTLNSLPQYSAAGLPWAHQVACRPALENAAFSGFSERPAATPANAGPAPSMPSVATAPPAVATVRKSRLVLSNVSVIASSVVNRSMADIHASLAARTRSGKARRYPVRGSKLAV